MGSKRPKLNVLMCDLPPKNDGLKKKIFRQPRATERSVDIEDGANKGAADRVFSQVNLHATSRRGGELLRKNTPRAALGDHPLQTQGGSWRKKRGTPAQQLIREKSQHTRARPRPLAPPAPVGPLQPAHPGV